MRTIQRADNSSNSSPPKRTIFSGAQQLKCHNEIKNPFISATAGQFEMSSLSCLGNLKSDAEMFPLSLSQSHPHTHPYTHTQSHTHIASLTHLSFALLCWSTATIQLKLLSLRARKKFCLRSNGPATFYQLKEEASRPKIDQPIALSMR